ncbi:MAG: potassium channel protein [Planctomycetota bacterium]|nr:MAG: potassium channel protein [Planctomycetota bacterium]
MKSSVAGPLFGTRVESEPGMHDEPSPFSRAMRVMVVLFALTAVGIVWFWLVEGWSLIDAAYMTVITLTTVGYREVRPLTLQSQVFLMFYLIGGLGVFLFSVVELGEMIVRAELTGWLRRREMTTALKSMHEHYIVCGFGRMGRSICQQLSRHGLPLVVVDHDDQAVSECEQQGWLCVRGDATDDRVLMEAGIDRARGLAVVLDSDADNLYTVLSARLLSPGLQIIARATDQTSARKMERAGADRVVCLYAAGARTMAQFMINPRVEDFFEVVSSAGAAMDLAELRIAPESKYAGKVLKETDFRQRGVVIVAIRRSSGELEIPPSANSRIEVGDRLIALGDAQAISDFLAHEKSASAI